MNGLLKYKPNEKINAIYVRLSVEEKKREPSESIANQIKILEQLAISKGLTNTKIYSDDCISGSNFNRPAFNQMIDNIKSEKVNCILLKDLSRFGREHIDGDYYLEIFLPKHGVRLITKIEGFDSFLNPKRMNSIEAPLINLFNEQYIKQVSNSTKASLHIKRKEGKCVLPQVPYGYLRCPLDKYRLIVDKEVKDVIVSIFTMYINGNSLSEIARVLESRRILPPSQHKRKNTGKEINYNSTWGSCMIKNILSQDILLGHMVQGKTASYSHKVKTRVPLPREKWIIVKNTHEAIIDEETFNIVNSLLKKQSRPKSKKIKKTKPSVLSGFVICKDCNNKMQRTMTTKNKIPYYYFRCSINKKLGSSICSNHMIPESILIDVVISSINSLINSFVDIEDAITKNKRNEASLMKKQISHRLDVAIKERERLVNTNSKLYHSYINKLDDMLTDEVYINMKNRYQKLSSRNKEEILALKEKQSNLEEGTAFETDFLKEYSKYTGIKVLTRDIVADLVDKIIIGADKSINIMFKFQDEIINHKEFIDHTAIKV